MTKGYKRYIACIVSNPKISNQNMALKSATGKNSLFSLDSGKRKEKKQKKKDKKLEKKVGPLAVITP